MDTARLPIGNRFLTYGTWNGAGVVTGEIDTGLHKVDVFLITHTGAAVEADVATADEAFPLAGSDVTMVCTAGDTGNWLAVGV